MLHFVWYSFGLWNDLQINYAGNYWFNILKHFNKVAVRVLLSALGGLSQKTSPPKFLHDILVFNVSLYDSCTIKRNKTKIAIWLSAVIMFKAAI